MKTLYMKCTTDKLELPLVVEDTPTKLAGALGLKPRSVATLCSKQKCGYHRIQVEDFVIPVCYPNNDGGLWYKDPDTWETVYVEDL